MSRARALASLTDGNAPPAPGACSRRLPRSVAVAAALVALLVLGGARSAPAIEVPGTAGHLTADGYLDGLAVAETEGGARQRPQAVGDLKLDAAVTRAVRGFVELRGRVGGPFEGGPGPGVYNFDDTFQNRSPSVEVSEAWAEFRMRRAEVRAGIQRLAWGKLDGIPPTDVVNPRDYHDPLVDDFEERKIGIPALLGTYYLPDVTRWALHDLRLTAVYVPIAVPSRLALVEERWFPRSTVPPPRFVISRGELNRLGIPATAPLVIPVTLETDNRRPPRGLDAGGIGLRLGGTWRDYDWDLYHYTGPETAPDVDLRPELFLDSPPPDLRVHAVSRLVQAHDSIHMTGGDLAAPVGGFTLRAEGAYFVDRPYLRVASDLVTPEALRRLPIKRIIAQLTSRGRADVPLGELFPARDAVEWGAGVDYLWKGWQPLLQVNQFVLLEQAPRLLLNDPETRLVAVLRKHFFGERLELEFRGAYTLERHWWFAFPRASYLLRDDLRLRAGYLAIGGPRTSLIGQFAKNDEVVLQVRYSF